MPKFFIWCLASLILFSACQSGTTTPEKGTEAYPATLKIDQPVIGNPNEFFAILTIHNPADFEIEIAGPDLEMISWQLEIKNSNGENVPHVSPPVPGPAIVNAPPIRIEPKGSYSQNITQLAVDPNLLGTAKFQVRFNGKAMGINEHFPALILESEWMEIEVKGNPDAEKDVVVPEVN